MYDALPEHGNVQDIQIISTRIPNSNEHFGNPFSHDPAGKTQGLIKTETVQEAVEKYIDWVINGANFEKKNLFTVKPIQSVDKKATVKASIATQYIGFGEGINNSSTELYRQQAGKYANTGNYSERDTVFVSIGGKRGTEQQQKEQQDKTIKEALKAIEDGAILITDNKSYVDSNSYNTGEKRLAQNLTTKGYNYTEKTVDGQVLGVWFKGELNPLRSEWIREELKSEKHKGKTILYYKELGEPSHATALDYLINNYNINQIEIIDKDFKISNLTNHSGGAKGGDETWDKEGRKIGITNHNHYTVDFYDKLTDKERNELNIQYLQTVKFLGRGVISENTYSGKLVRRDMIQANKSDAIYGVTELIKPNTIGRKGYKNKMNYSIPEGGTGYAVARGILLDKPVYVFNQSEKYGNEIGWYKWNNTKKDFVKTETPKLTKNYAGIGSQEINNLGIESIKEVYKKTLKEGEQKQNIQTTLDFTNIPKDQSDELNNCPIRK